MTSQACLLHAHLMTDAKYIVKSGTEAEWKQMVGHNFLVKKSY